MSSIDKDPMLSSLLHPRWRLCNHPPYDDVMAELQRPITTSVKWDPLRVTRSQLDESNDIRSDNDSEAVTAANVVVSDVYAAAPVINAVHTAQRVLAAQRAQQRQVLEQPAVLRANVDFGLASLMNEAQLTCMSSDEANAAMRELMTGFIDEWKRKGVQPSTPLVDAATSNESAIDNSYQNNQSSLNTRKKKRVKRSTDVQDVPAEPAEADNTSEVPTVPQGQRTQGCTLCFARGHNKRTCPTRIKEENARNAGAITPPTGATHEGQTHGCSIITTSVTEQLFHNTH